MLIAVLPLPPPPPPIHGSPGLGDGLLCCGVSTTPLLEPQQVLFPSFSSAFTVALAQRGGVAFLAPLPHGLITDQ